MNPSIPVSAIVAVTPGVITGGGTAIDLAGLFLTENTRLPEAQVLSLPTLASVTAYFGGGSTEETAAGKYFLGFDNSNKKPGSMLFARYNAANAAAFLRGGSLTAVSLTALQALSGSLNVTVDGTPHTAASVNLAAATSFTNAATIMSTALSPIVVTYDSVAAAFVITSGTTGSSSTIAYATGTLAAGVMLTQATGAILSQGALADTPSGAMNRVAAITTNWGTFTTLFEPSASDKVLFAAWTNLQVDRYAYVLWSTEVTATQNGDTTSSGAQIVAANDNGTILIYDPSNGLALAAFMCGLVASIDFNELNGRTTAAFRSQTGITPNIVDQATAAQLEANGWNFYGAYATAAQGFNFLYPGQITGPFKWVDSYINQIWLNSQLQLAMMELLVTAKSIPYNPAGYALIEAAASDPIRQAVVFGAIREGVTLSQAQINEVNAAAGLRIDGALSTRGWYFQVLNPSTQVRAARQSPPCTLWYMDGESIQRIALASINVQ